MAMTNSLVNAVVVIPIVILISLAIYSQFSGNLDRSSWSTTANTTYASVNTGTYNGFNLATMLPFIVIAITVVGLILAAFGLGFIGR